MEVCDGTSKDVIRKRHFVEEEGFQFPSKPLKKAASQPSAPPVVTSNKFGMLDNAGPSTSSAAPETTTKKSRMPPIVVSANSVNINLI